MRYIFLNLKRFDIRPEDGGVNRLAPVSGWASAIAASLDAGLRARPVPGSGFAFPVFFPEAHILPACAAIPGGGPLSVGCQSVHHADTSAGGNFGAFTTLRTANAAKELGCSWTIIGHSEERRYKAELMSLAGADPRQAAAAIDEILNREVKCALGAGLKVLFCIGETAEEVPRRAEILRAQVGEGLAGIDSADVVLAYEPVWAIGPGKTPPAAEEIAAIAAGIKAITPRPLVYGGGLKKENAESIGRIADLDGGLVALTRFAGEIGFYPGEYLEIVDAYLRGCAAAGARAGGAER